MKVHFDTCGRSLVAVSPVGAPALENSAFRASRKVDTNDFQR